MSYLDQILNIAENSPTPEEAEYLKHIRALGAGAPTIENSKNSASTPQQTNNALQYESPPPVREAVANKVIGQSSNLPRMEDYPVSKGRNIVGNILGVIGSLHGKGIEKGIESAEAYKEAPYRKALSNFQTEQESLKQPLAAEQDINKNETTRYTVGGKRQLDVAKVNQGEEGLDIKGKQLNLNTKKEADQLTAKYQDLNDRMARASDRLELETLVKEKESLDREAATKSRETIADKNLTASQNRFNMSYGLRQAEFAEKRGDTKGAGDSIWDVVSKNDDPASQQEALKNATPETRNYILANHPEAASILQHTTQELNNDRAARSTMDLVTRTKTNLMQPGIKELLGGVHGRLEQGRIAWSSDNPNLQALVTDLNNLPIAEAAANGAGRSTGVLVKLFQKGTGSLKDQYDTFLRALDETNEFAKLRRIDHNKISDFNKDFSIVGGTK